MNKTIFTDAVSKTKKAAVLGVLVLTILSSGGEAAEFYGLPSVKEIAAASRENAPAVPPVPAPERSARQTAKEWTIMVFMNGKNDLTDQVLADINEMEELGAPANVNLVVQAGRSPSATQWAGVRRYLIGKDTNKSDISSELVMNTGNTDMGDWHSLENFGRWAKQTYPARKYMLIVWNHGSGWKMEQPAEEKSSAKGISYDDETGHMISPVDLAAAIRGMGGVEIYASDACLMQMAEVVYELRDTAKIVVGSEESEPEEGWDYREFLGQVHSNSAGLTPEVLATAAVQGYMAYYQKHHDQVTMSALRTQGMEKLRALVDQWIELAMLENREAAVDVSSEVLAFDGSDSVDLLNFMELVQGRSDSAGLKAKTAEVMDYFYRDILLDIGATGSNFKKAGGLAVYLPVGAPEESYKGLSWARDGRWDEFTQWFSQR